MHIKIELKEIMKKQILQAFVLESGTNSGKDVGVVWKKLALGRSQGKSDFPEGCSPELKEILNKQILQAFVLESGTNSGKDIGVVWKNLP